mmetsp:Transcript_57111/g.173878  ORF Transcript_57111/g.173878 Transcript_57111/m.173878 type:complete len:301 (+) Transcript_57111:799-1701(+)
MAGQGRGQARRLHLHRQLGRVAPVAGEGVLRRRQTGGITRGLEPPQALARAPAQRRRRGLLDQPLAAPGCDPPGPGGEARGVPLRLGGHHGGAPGREAHGALSLLRGPARHRPHARGRRRRRAHRPGPGAQLQHREPVERGAVYGGLRGGGPEEGGVRPEVHAGGREDGQAERHHAGRQRGRRPGRAVRAERDEPPRRPRGPAVDWEQPLPGRDRRVPRRRRRGPLRRLPRRGRGRGPGRVPRGRACGGADVPPGRGRPVSPARYFCVSCSLRVVRGPLLHSRLLYLLPRGGTLATPYST